MTKPILLLLLLPVPALAAAIDASAVPLQTAETVYTVGLVGGSVLGVYACLGAFRYVREVIGVASPFDTSRDLAPHVRGYVDQASYLEALGQRLAAENEAAPLASEQQEIFFSSSEMAAEREEIFLTAADYGSAAGDFFANESEYAASMREEAAASGADMALYDKFIAEVDVTHDEAVRWSSMGGQVKMPVEPGTSSSWDAQGNYVAPLKSWEQR